MGAGSEKLQKIKYEKMSFRLKPVIKEIMSILKKYGFEIIRIRGDHIIVNKNPPLRRPIVLVNVKRLSNAVRLNLLKECENCGIDKTEFNGIFKEKFLKS